MRAKEKHVSDKKQAASQLDNITSTWTRHLSQRSTPIPIGLDKDDRWVGALEDLGGKESGSGQKIFDTYPTTRAQWQSGQ